MNSALFLHNTCRLSLTDIHGNIVSDTIKENITCDIWRASLLKRLSDDTTTGLWKIQHIAIGIGTQTPSVGLSQLNNENLRSAVDTIRTVFSWTQIKVYASFWTWTSLSVSEAWVFLDSTSTLSPNTGSILCYSTGWTPIIKPTDQVLTIEWTININNATV